MKELAIVISNDNINGNPYETIDAIKRAGFNNVFIQWYDEDTKWDQYKQLEYARSLDLNVVFAHLGYQGINNLWLDNEDGNKLEMRFIDDIKVCKENGIDFVVLHLTSKSVAPEYNEIGLNRLKNICNYAKDIGVKVAFENTKIKGYIDYVLSNIDYPGFCFDVGHYHAHFNDEFNFDLVKNRVYAVHIHDNYGELDSHFLPYDGNVNYDDFIDKLHYVNYDSYLTLEVIYTDHYKDISIDEFYQRSYELGNILLNKYGN